MITLLLFTKFTCHECGSAVGSTMKLHPGDTMPKPCLPLGWTEIGPYQYCSKHKVEIWVNGQPTALL